MCVLVLSHSSLTCSSPSTSSSLRQRCERGLCSSCEASAPLWVERQATVSKLLPSPWGHVHVRIQFRVWQWGSSGLKSAQTITVQYPSDRRVDKSAQTVSLSALSVFLFQQIRRLWINYATGKKKTPDSLKRFTSRRRWQKDVPPCCPHRRSNSSKGYQPKFQDRNRRDEQGEIDLRSFDEEGLRWKKLSEHKRLLHSCSFCFLSLSKLLPLSYFRFEQWTQTGVVADSMYDAACLSLSIFNSYLKTWGQTPASATDSPSAFSYPEMWGVMKGERK